VLHWKKFLRARKRVAVPVLALILAFSTAAADVRPSPLDYHATVVNGTLTGSSFMIDEGIVVTNAHVLEGRSRGATVKLVVPGARGRRTNAVVLAVSHRMDLALLRVSENFLPVAPAGAAREGRGRALVAAGMEPRSTGSGRRMTIAGRVSSGKRTLAPYGTGIIATMPGIRRGFSGGPVFDADGQLFGMVAALRPGADSNVGRDAFILTADEIRAEARRLLRSL
jgi:S1-C subfamily serine protease